MTLASPAARPAIPTTLVSADDQRDQRAKMIEENLPLVSFVMNRMSDAIAASMLDREDAHSYGVEGLIQAIDNYDPERGCTLGTFALLRIRGSILDAIRKHDILPRSTRKRLREVEGANTELANRLGRWPSVNELAMFTGIPVEEIREVLNTRGARTISLERSMDSEFAESTTWDIEDKNENTNPVASLDRLAMTGLLEKALGTLSDRDRQIVELRYKRALPISTIGRMLNVSESRVSQLHKRILSSLNKQLRADLAA